MAVHQYTVANKNKITVNERNSCSAGTTNDSAITDTEIRYIWVCEGSNGGTASICYNQKLRK